MPPVPDTPELRTLAVTQRNQASRQSNGLNVYRLRLGLRRRRSPLDSSGSIHSRNPSGTIHRNHSPFLTPTNHQPPSRDTIKIVLLETTIANLRFTQRGLTKPSHSVQNMFPRVTGNCDHPIECSKKQITI
jgi:hypothetical protein